jgi:hypothetical protein
MDRIDVIPWVNALLSLVCWAASTALSSLSHYPNPTSIQKRFLQLKSFLDLEQLPLLKFAIDQLIKPRMDRP